MTRERRDAALHRRRARAGASRPAGRRGTARRAPARARGSRPSRPTRRSRPPRRSPRAARGRACPSRSVAERLVAAGRTLYGRQRSSSSRAPVGEPEVRAEELVRRADQHVHAERGDVDRPVRRVVDGVRPGERARLVRELGDAPRVDERADRVRRERERDDARPLRELRLQVVEVERRVVAQVGEPDDQLEVVRELQPGRDVRVVVEPRDEDLVARRSSRPTVRESAKLSVVMFAPKTTSSGAQPRKPAAGEPRFVDERVAPPGSSRRARRGSRSTRAGSRRSPRSPRPAPACRPARRRGRAAGRARRSAPGRPRRRGRARPP